MCEQAQELRKRIETLEATLRTIIVAEENGEFTEGGSPWDYFVHARKVLDEG